MMNDLFKMRGRKPPTPKLYDLSCRTCNYQEMVRLVDDLSVLETAAENTEAAAPRHVESLPRICPRCGATLKHREVPVFVQY